MYHIYIPKILDEFNITYSIIHQFWQELLPLEHILLLPLDNLYFLTDFNETLQ